MREHWWCDVICRLKNLFGHLTNATNLLIHQLSLLFGNRNWCCGTDCHIKTSMSLGKIYIVTFKDLSSQVTNTKTWFRSNGEAVGSCGMSRSAHTWSASEQRYGSPFHRRLESRHQRLDVSSSRLGHADARMRATAALEWTDHRW